MDHVALDRAGAHDRHLDHEVVEGLGLHPRQHRHLRAALDLEHAEGIGAPDHRVGRAVLRRDRGEVVRVVLDLGQKVEGAAQAAEHAEPEHVDLHEFQGVDVVLVPFDDLTVGHRRGLDRDQLVEAVQRQHEAAGMLREVARRADQLAGDLERQAQAPVVGVEVEFAQLPLADALAAPGPGHAVEGAGHVLGQAHHLADLAERPPRAEAADDGGERRAVAAVGLKDPLDHLLAALVLEIDVDVGRLAARLGDEAFEQQVLLHRVDRGDPQAEADRGIGRRAAALAQNLLLVRETDDRFDREEVGRVSQAPDQVEFVAQLARHRLRHAVGIARLGPGPGQRLQALLRREPVLADLGRVGVGEMVQREGAGGTDLARPRQRLGEAGEQARGLLRGFEEAVGVTLLGEARPVDGEPEPDTGHHVLQAPPSRDVVEDVAGGDGGHPGGPRGGGHRIEPVRVVGPEASGQRAGGAGAERLLELDERCGEAGLRMLGQQNREKPLLPLFEIGPGQAAAALAAPRLAQAEQAAEPAIGGAVGRIDEHRQRVVEVEPAADDEAHARHLRRLMCPHHPGERTVIGDAERRDAEQSRSGKKLLRARCPAQEGEVRRDLKLRDGHVDVHHVRPRSDVTRSADHRRPAVAGAASDGSSPAGFMPRRARAATSAPAPPSARRETARSARRLPSRPGNSHG